MGHFLWDGPYFDIPATHGFDLCSLSLAECREIDRRFGEGLPRFAALDSGSDHDLEDLTDDEDEEEEDHNNGWRTSESDESPALRPMLVFFDRLLFIRRENPPNWLRKIAVRFSQIRRHTGLPLAGIWAFCPDSGSLGRMEFVYQMRDRVLIREALLECLTSLVDIESIDESSAGTNGFPDYLAARRDVINQVRNAAELPADQGQFKDSLRAYDSAVQAELAEPLVSWARQSRSPVVRAAGTQLAETVSLLHLITPRLHAVQSSQPREFAGVGNGWRDSSGLFKQYLQLLDRFSRLTGEILSWMKP